MVGQGLLLIAVVGALAAGAAIEPSTRAEVDCTQVELTSGLCTSTSGAINGSGVDVSAHQDSPGRSAGAEESTDASDDGPEVAADPASDPAPGSGRVPHERYGVICDVPACAVADTPAVQLSDLASFHPASPRGVSEPNGWAVVGLDANFVAHAPTQVLAGTLLGRRAEVRFTAVRYRWSYGDGSTRTTTDGGASWSRLGVPEFTATGTSHVYRNHGSFPVQLTVGYSPEYRIGTGGWTRIAGLLDLSAARFTVVAGDAATVLVGRDCVQNPRGPGC